MNKTIGILIPAHNEERTIGKLVVDMKERFRYVIVVDDGSTDKTREIAEQNGAKVLRHERCRGKGEAIKTGFRHISKLKLEAFITMDGDGQHLPTDAEALAKAYERNRRPSIWTGRRKIKGTEMPNIRRACNVVQSFVISLIARQKIPDTQCGLRLIKTGVMEDLKLFTSNFETETEILIKASWKGHKIGSVPISTVYGQEKSKMRSIVDTKRFIKVLFIVIFPGLERYFYGRKSTLCR